MSLWTNAELYAIGLMERKLEMEGYHHNFFTRFYGMVDERNSRFPRDASEMPTAPILVYRRFASEGQDNLTVPMLRNLTNTQIFGNKRAKGTGEAQALLYSKVYINQRRSTWSGAGRQSNLHVSTLKLFNQARPQLTIVNARWTEVGIARSFYEKYSQNVTDTAANGGLAITKIQHPNIYAADSGEITWSATAATYASSIHTARTGLTGASDDLMGYGTLIKFDSYCTQNEIPFMEVGGHAFRPLLIHTNQARQLRQDSTYQSIQQNAEVRSMLKNSSFHGAMGFCAGFLLFERQFSPMGLTTTSSTTTWGATNPLTGVDTNAVKGAICFSNHSIAGGWAQGPNFAEEIEDFGNHKEIAVGMVDGFARNDFLDSQTAGSETINVNKSSALLLTYSPN